MTDSILDSTKKMLGIAADYDAFDLDVIMNINSVFSTLAQLGVGPAVGFMIEDNTKLWTDILGSDLNLNAVKQYVYLKVRLAFDPPATSFHIQAINEQIKELEWRINVQREAGIWVDHTLADLGFDPFADRVVLDGGVG